MNHYVVLYWEPVHLAADPPLAFLCQADDDTHAEEQCLDAEEEGTEIAWVWEVCPVDEMTVDEVINGTAIDDAYNDYWGG